ncbi:hypothetical protein MRX96_044913, partial [Rhipicephalus microplus]
SEHVDVYTFVYYAASNACTVFPSKRRDLRSCSLTDVQEDLFVHPKNLTHLWLDGNDIESVQPRAFSHLSRLQVLSLTRNKLVRLSAHDLTGLVSLRTLNLAYNKLSDVTGAFTVLGSLRTLDLEGNRLDVIPDDTFWPLRSIESLNLRKNVFRTASSDLFAPLRNITHIYFSDFSLCSSALHVRVCEPRGDGISSLAHLLDSVVLRVAVWVVALVACLGNLLVLVGETSAARAQCGALLLHQEPGTGRPHHGRIPFRHCLARRGVPRRVHPIRLPLATLCGLQRLWVPVDGKDPA